MNNRKAFTLAEVLITLGIIGVVAALTLPALIQNYKKSVVENKLKEDFSLFSNAIRMAESKNGTTDEWPTCEKDSGFECTKDFFDNYLAPELKTIKICGKNNKDECWTEPASLSGTKGYLKPQDMALTAILSNGTSLYMWAGAQLTSPHWQIWIDIDGPNKGKGIIGADVFGINFFYKEITRSDRPSTKSGIYMVPNYSTGADENYIRNDTENGCSKSINSRYAGRFCGGLIQYNGWKIPKDYPVRF